MHKLRCVCYFQLYYSFQRNPLSVSVLVSWEGMFLWFYYSSCLVAHFFLVFPILFSLAIFLLPSNFALVPQLPDLVNVASVKTFLNNYLHLESGILPGSFCFVKKLFIRSLTTYFLPSHSTNWTFNRGPSDLPKGEK